MIHCETPLKLVSSGDLPEKFDDALSLVSRFEISLDQINEMIETHMQPSGGSEKYHSAACAWLKVTKITVHQYARNRIYESKFSYKERMSNMA